MAIGVSGLSRLGCEMDNTHWLDIVIDPQPGQSPPIGWHVSREALPIDERGHVRQDRGGFALYENEDNGFAEYECTFYLLLYYMAKYHKIIE